MNRGSPRNRRSTTGLAGSFNEAPIHESGKFVSGVVDLRRRSPCFNEAPIHESGKYLDRIEGLPLAWSFNEAPIHESGKWSLIDSAHIQQFMASMRPRFMNRGSPSGGRR